MIGQILDMLGHQLAADELQVYDQKLTMHCPESDDLHFQGIIAEIDADGNGEMSFDEFAHLAARFLVEEDEDTEAILKELKDAFRLYDKEGTYKRRQRPSPVYYG